MAKHKRDCCPSRTVWYFSYLHVKKMLIFHMLGILISFVPIVSLSLLFDEGQLANVPRAHD